MQVSDFPVFPHPCLYAGDFNFQHVDWVYDASSADGKCLVGWASANNFVLLHNPKDAVTFHSGCWNTSTNPDLAFVSIDLDSRLPDRQILEKFLRPQHRPSLITPPRFARPVPSRPVKLWNFRKATIFLSQINLPGFCRHLMWIRHISVSVTASPLQRKSVSHVADEIIVCHVGMASVKTSTKHSCNTLKGMNLAEMLQLCLLGNGEIDGLRSSRTLTFSHSSRVAWSMLNNLTGRSRHSPLQCPISANAIASQLIKNGK